MASHAPKHKHFGEAKVRNTFSFPHSMNPPVIAFQKQIDPKEERFLKLKQLGRKAPCLFSSGAQKYSPSVKVHRWFQLVA